jgi:hypothetical protein
VLAGNKTVLLSLTGNGTASIGRLSAAVLNIVDRQSAGTLQFATSTASVREGDTVRVTVVRTGSNLVGTVSVNWAATGGTATAGVDFTPSSGTLTFGPGITRQSFDLTATDDGIPEGTERIVLSLSSPTGGAALSASTSMTVFIIDKQQTVGVAGNVTISEKTTPANVQIVRSGVPSGTVSVTVNTVNGTAVAGQDYLAANNQVVTFAAGDIIKTVPITILTGNASTRNGNRTFSVMLSNPINAALNSASTSTVTILDSRPDLIITSVSAPSSTLTGKAVSTPSMVKNVGALGVTTPFSIGLFLVRAEDFDPDNPSGNAPPVTSVDVPGLAAGATAAFPTQITINDDLPAGDYYLAAVANLNNKISEADSNNNARSSFPTKIEVRKNLTKFKSATAAFSQTSPPTTGPARVAAAACDVTGSVILTGTFGISQTSNTITGQAILTGSLDDQPVQYTLLFSGTADANGNVTATVDSVSFTSLTRNLTGSGTGSLTGGLNGRVLAANVAGQFTTSTGGACVFTGTLQAQAQTSFLFRLAASSQVSIFGAGVTPAEPSFPVTPNGVAPELKVFFDSDLPDSKTVIFTGPAGSGIASKPADPQNSEMLALGAEARYRTATIGGTGFPGGQWIVSYRGQGKSFTLPSFNANASFVVVFPTAVVDEAGNLTGVNWVYRNRLNGNALTTSPAFIAGISVQALVNGGGLSRSAILSPSTASFNFAAGGVSPPAWATVSGIRFEYTDLAGNLIIQEYGKSSGPGIVIDLPPNVVNHAVSVKLGSPPLGPPADGTILDAVSVSLGTPTVGASGGTIFDVVSVAQAPVVEGLSVTAAAPGSSFVLTITGTNLQGATDLEFHLGTGSDSQVVASSIVANPSGTSLRANVSVSPSAAPGTRIVIVRMLDGQSTYANTGANTFTVQ